LCASTSILRSCPTRSERYAVLGLLQLEFNLADGGAVGVFGASASRLTAGAAGFLNLSQAQQHKQTSWLFNHPASG